MVGNVNTRSNENGQSSSSSETPSQNQNPPQTSQAFMGALALIPIFSGNNVKDFIKSVNSAGKLARCDPFQLAEIAKLKFSGEANNFLDANPNLEDVEWPALRAEIEKRFGEKGTLQSNRMKLKDCFQQDDESVREYVTRLKLIGYQTVRNCPDPAEKEIRKRILDEDLLTQFLCGLKKEISRFVYSHNPTDLESAATRAEHEEQFSSGARTEVLVNKIAAPSVEPPRSNYNSAASREPSFDRDRRPRDRTPYRSPSAPRDNTPYRSSSAPRDNRRPSSEKETRTCYYCNRRGHIERFCRTKQAALQGRSQSFQINNRGRESRQVSFDNSRSRFPSNDRRRHLNANGAPQHRH